MVCIYSRLLVFRSVFDIIGHGDLLGIFNSIRMDSPMIDQFVNAFCNKLLAMPCSFIGNCSFWLS